MRWRLGLDIGTNSLGWSVLTLSDQDMGNMPCGIEASGVRIFSDGRNAKSKESNAATRRAARGIRKNKDRYLNRRTNLLNTLVDFGLLPKDRDQRKALEGKTKDTGGDLADFDPWVLRSRGLDDRLSLYQFGRAIFHLHQRRGFQSNRKSDSKDNEKGAVKIAIKRTKDAFSENSLRTLGELLGKPRQERYEKNKILPKGQREPQPQARVKKTGSKSNLHYDYYPSRAMIADEFDKLWEKQSAYYPDVLHDKARTRIRDIIVWQHPLKSQKDKIGKCALLPENFRASKALPSSQLVRIYQEVNHLRIIQTGKESRPLTIEERDSIADSLIYPTNKTANRTFAQLHKLIGLSTRDSFNLESGKRKFLLGNQTTAILQQDQYWGKEWLSLSLPQQEEIVDRLLDEEDEEQLVRWLCEKYDVSEDQAHSIADCSLTDGYGNLSKEAIDKILPELVNDVCTYDQACAKVGIHHSHHGTGEVFDTELPYYGYVLQSSVAFGSNEESDPDEKRYGKVANPTVHVALNQVQQVVNDLLRRFGRPEQVVVELARDLPLSANGKSELASQQTENQKANEKRAETLQAQGQPNTYANRLRLRLYEELEPLEKCCVFSGKQIALHELFSDAIEVEHILPRGRTLDDSISNKTLCIRQANRDKGNRSPYEAFGHSPDGYDWDSISARIEGLPNNKKWRFGSDAMQRFENEEQDFLARQLNDTRYIGRLAKNYLQALYGGQGYKGSENRVWVITGRLTSDLRHHWGLNSVLLGDNLSVEQQEKLQKNRDDHRHHAIDAIVVGCTDRATLQRAANEASKAKEACSERLLAGIASPWKGFREDVKAVVRDIVISPKPDHGHQAAMLEETAFGLIKGVEGNEDKNGKRGIVVRKSLESIEKSKDLNKIRDPHLKKAFIKATQGLSGKAFKEALIKTGQEMSPPVYKVRLEERGTVVPIRDAKGNTYKAYRRGSNYCCDIWQNEQGKWEGEIISTYQAYQLAKEYQAKQQNDAWWQHRVGRNQQPLLMRIRKNDLLEIDHDNRRVIVVVYKMSDGYIYCAEHFEANVAARTNATVRKDKIAEEFWLNAIMLSPKKLQQVNGKLVTVSPSGKVFIHD